MHEKNISEVSDQLKNEIKIRDIFNKFTSKTSKGALKKLPSLFYSVPLLIWRKGPQDIMKLMIKGAWILLLLSDQMSVFDFLRLHLFQKRDPAGVFWHLHPPPSWCSAHSQRDVKCPDCDQPEQRVWELCPSEQVRIGTAFPSSIGEQSWNDES